MFFRRTLKEVKLTNILTYRMKRSRNKIHYLPVCIYFTPKGLLPTVYRKPAVELPMAT